ncbi:MAG: hypothetical protein JNG86_01335, partial [Verrucomicrobiaceae bacterium]|nr:hypothetical protein [Verrucomicrobiaceae bacterium]
AAQEVKKFEIKADDWKEGEPPAEVFVVDGKVQIAAKDGNKALVIEPGTELVDGSAQLAVSAAGNASVQARVFASKQGRSTPRFGISVHGMSGYRLYVNPAKKQLELVKADQTVATVPFTWKSDAWLTMKLEAKKAAGDAWSITGSVWADGEAAPAAPQIKHEDKGLKGQGKCAVWATPFSGKPVFFDDIAIEVETAAEAK